MMTTQNWDRTLLQSWDIQNGREQNIHSSYNAIVTAETELLRTHMGKTWLFSKEINNTAVGSSYYLVIVPNSGSTADLHMRNAMLNISAGPACFCIYESPFTNAASMGTEVTSSFNTRNRNTSLARGFTAFENPYINVASLGLKLDFYLIEEAGGGPIKQASGGAEIQSEIIFDNEKQYLITFTNKSTNVASYADLKAYIVRMDD